MLAACLAPPEFIRPAQMPIFWFTW